MRLSTTPGEYGSYYRNWSLLSLSLWEGFVAVFQTLLVGWSNNYWWCVHICIHDTRLAALWSDSGQGWAQAAVAVAGSGLAWPRLTVERRMPVPRSLSVAPAWCGGSLDPRQWPGRVNGEGAGEAERVVGHGVSPRYIGFCGLLAPGGAQWRPGWMIECCGRVRPGLERGEGAIKARNYLPSTSKVRN